MTLECLAIIVDESVSMVGSVGKKKNIECCLPMFRIDRFTFRCKKGHLRKTQAYEYKGYLDFIPDQIIEEYQKSEF